MNRRDFVTGAMAAGLAGSDLRRRLLADCAADVQPVLPAAPGRLKITGIKPIGVTWDAKSDRPYVFVKIETDKGVVGWGEATLEGKAGAVIATIDDLRELLVGQDPMRVEHLWQVMYVHS